MENGLRVLKHLGLLDEIVAAGAPVVSYNMHKIDGQLVASFKVINKDDLITVNILRSSITRIIYTALNKEGVFLKYDKHLTGIEQPTDGSLGVKATFRDGTFAHGDILIGADGVHSGVRSILFPDRKPFKSGFVGYFGVTEYSDEFNWPSRALNFFTNNVAGKSGYIMRTSDARIHWAIYEAKQEDISHDHWESLYDLDAEAARIAALARSWQLGPAFEPMIRKSIRIIPMTIWDLETLPTWHRGNCVLVGDAAHAMVPFVGQGASVSLEDVDVLTALLQRLPSDPRRAFELFQEARYPRAKKIAESARTQGKRQYATSPFSTFVGLSFLRLFAFIARVTNTSLNPEEVLAYDGYDVVRQLIIKKGLLDNK
ncbi:hypothetical protein DFJ73DRAFT_769444 [Zopfochytrium polystomum]|nr:hypothetical protein DFJ73DRAFT_769444 [Zopfochytrium polystomum]